MNRERDFDQTLRDWLIPGADRAPERYVNAAIEQVERTNQRGAGVALLEGLLMKMKPTAPILGVAAVLLLTIAVIQVVGGRSGGPMASNGQPTPTATTQPTPLPTPTRAPITSREEIVLTDANVAGVTLDNMYRDATVVISYPVRSARATDLVMRELDALVGGIVTELTGREATLVSFVAEFETVADAERVLNVYLEDFGGADGWGLELVGTSGPDGPEGANFEGRTSRFLPGPPSEDKVPAGIRIWRFGRVVVAIGAFFEYDDPGLHMIGDNMAARAQSYAGVSR